MAFPRECADGVKVQKIGALDQAVAVYEAGRGVVPDENGPEGNCNQRRMRPNPSQRECTGELLDK